jgi:hypothetical protein
MLKLAQTGWGGGARVAATTVGGASVEWEKGWTTATTGNGAGEALQISWQQSSTAASPMVRASAPTNPTCHRRISEPTETRNCCVTPTVFQLREPVARATSYQSSSLHVELLRLPCRTALACELLYLKPSLSRSTPERGPPQASGAMASPPPWGCGQRQSCLFTALDRHPIGETSMRPPSSVSVSLYYLSTAITTAASHREPRLYLSSAMALKFH